MVSITGSLVNIIGLYSKSNNAAFEENQELSRAVSNSAVIQVEAVENEAEQKTLYGLLTSSERYNLWLKRINSIKQNVKLNRDQAKFLDELFNKLSPDLFNDKIALENKLTLLTSIQEESTKLFGLEKAKDLFASLKPIEVNVQGAVELGEYPPGTGTCDCSRSSDWCGTGYVCGRVGCTVSSAGCGTLLIFACDGDCWFN